MGWNIFQEENFRKGFTDHSTKSLIMSNLILIIIALIEDWELIIILFVYVIQSIIIGIFNMIRIISLKDFSVNGMQPPSTKSTKTSTALFFGFHYNFFHFVYFMFVFPETYELLSNNLLEIISVIAMIILFLINHYYSFRYNKERDLKRKIKISKLMFLPYARIFPMHLTLFIAAATMDIGVVGSKIALLSFLLLKTAADVVMHVIEHRCF